MLSPMAERGKTRKQLVASTVELLRRQGAYGTGLHDVLDHSGAPRGSLYFHFPGGLREEGRDPEEAEALALTALSALEGALILSRARRSPDPLHAVAGQLHRLLS